MLDEHFLVLARDEEIGQSEVTHSFPNFTGLNFNEFHVMQSLKEKNNFTTKVLNSSPPPPRFFLRGK